MKSMSWLLHEHQSCIVRECQACGFSTRSPSIYRRHIRHCVVSGSAAQNPRESNGTSGITSTLSHVDVPGSHEDVGYKPSTDFSSVIRCECLNDGVLVKVSEAVDKDDQGGDKDMNEVVDMADHGGNKDVKDANVSLCVEEDGVTEKTSPSDDIQLQLSAVYQQSPVIDSDMQLTDSCDADVMDGAAAAEPMNIHCDTDVMDKAAETEPMNIHCDALDDSSTVNKISEVDDIHDTMKTSHQAHITSVSSFQSTPLAADDAMNNDDKLDSSEATGTLETAAAEDTTPSTERHVDTESPGRDIQTSSKKSSQNGKSSSRCCKYCKPVSYTHLTLPTKRIV